MKLFVPEPKITLYEDGFDKHDLLSRKPTADRLSDLVERIDDPLVIALDGTWGSGKSFFLKCWCGEHLKRAKNITTTVYFDAFAHDYLSDPLIALTGVIGDRFKDSPKSETALSKVKRAAYRLAPVATRLGLAALTAGATEMSGPILDAIIDNTNTDLTAAANAFWKQEDGKRAAMEQFRKALIELTEPNPDNNPTKKLVVVVDELDRCRPDYALNLLEVIKHFFAIPGVHFVLGVNLEQLENVIAKSYGGTNDRLIYLQKFIHLTFRLPSGGLNGSNSHNDIHFEKIANQVGLDNHQYREPLKQLIKRNQTVSLREVERLVSRAIITKPATSPNMRDWYLVAILIFLQITKPETLRRLLEDKAEKTELLGSLGRPRSMDGGYIDPNIDTLIDWLTNADFDPTVHLQQNVFAAHEGLPNPSGYVLRLHNNCLRGIDLPTS